MMIRSIKVIGIILFVAIANVSFAQSDKDKARAKGQEAIKLEDAGKYEEALALLDEAMRLDPDNHDYPYEVGFTYYLQKDYPKALDEFKKVVKYKDVTDQCFQMLGNIYDIMGDSESAFKAYDAGLKLFPKSGKLYLEKGNVYWLKKEYDKALPFYEQGIEAEPNFASNYYRAARIYCSSTEEVWGMIYGEIFMNLERGSARTAEISKLLFDTYSSEIKFTGKNSMSVSFCQNMVMTMDDLKDTNNIKLPFCMIYEPTLLISVIDEKKINLKTLDLIRAGFIENYYKMGHNKTHPNVLFDYQNTLLKEGYMEAYNHWILMKGDEKEFGKWKSKNEDKWNDFIKWFTDNGLTLDDTHKFYKSQY